MQHPVHNDGVGVCDLDNPEVASQLLTVLLVFLIHVEEQLLGHVACYLVLVVEARRDAQVQGLFRLFLTGALFEPASFATQSKLDNIVGHTLRRIFGADFDDPLHVAPLGSDETSSDLEVLFVVDLNIKTTCILDCVAILIFTLVLLGILLQLVGVALLKMLVLAGVLGRAVALVMLGWPENIIRFKQIARLLLLLC